MPEDLAPAPELEYTELSLRTAEDDVRLLRTRLGAALRPSEIVSAPNFSFWRLRRASDNTAYWEQGLIL